MGRKLTGVQATPVVNVRGVPHSTFEGILRAPGREVALKKGKSMVFEFELLTTDMSTLLKDDAGEYAECEVQKGDLVAIFAPTVLAGALSKAGVGESIRISYLGKVKPKKGAEYHDYDVDVI